MTLLLKYINKHKFWLSICILTAFFIRLCEVAIMNLLKDIVDYIENPFDISLVNYGVRILIILVIGTISYFFTIYSIGRFTPEVIRDIRKDAIERFIKLPVKYVDNNSTGDILGRINNDTYVVADFLDTRLSELILTPFLLIIYFSYLIMLNAKLFFISFAILPFITFIISKITKEFKARSKAYMEYLASTNDDVIEMVTQNSVVKAYNLVDKLENKYEEKLIKATNMAKKNDLYKVLQSPLHVVGYNTPYILAYAIGAYFCINGQLTLGELIVYVALISQAIHPCMKIQELFVSYKICAASVERINEVLTEEIEDLDKGNAFKAGNIELKNVSFGYVENNKVLKDINFIAEQGKITAIVGGSGSGKSTIVSLLLGFYNIEGGCIKIGDLALKDIAKNDLRQNISLVSQYSFLFPVSVYENIAIGKENATKQEVIEAAKKAYAHEFIMELSNGYDTIIGERGARLSGGQIQRIAIARAFIKDAPIVLLDEATSALDTKAEHYVQQAIDSLGQGKTVIVIAHRLSTIKNADKIIVLSKGSVVETGIHDELLNNNSYYSELYNTL